MPQTKPVEKPHHDARADSRAHWRHSRPARSVPDVRRHLLRSAGERGSGTAVEVLDWDHVGPARHCIRGQFYPGRFKTRSSRAPIGVPEQVRPIIEAWQQACPDPSPEALMFPTFGRGERTGQAVPRWGKNFLRRRVRPIARKLGIPDRLITFQVMRRTLGTDLQEHGTLKDAQGALRHASIQTTGDVYMQAIEGSVLQALNSRTSEILSDWKPTLVSGDQPIDGESATPKRRNVNLARGLTLNGPSSILKGVLSA
jgi:hypothetical protein